ncbi:hypothetical protein JOQ06_014953, partial [Pogonophryne albipinna]
MPGVHPKQNPRQRLCQETPETVQQAEEGIAFSKESSIRKKEHEKLGKYKGLRGELEKMKKVKATVVPVVIGALGAVTHKLGKWLQNLRRSVPKAL